MRIPGGLGTYRIIEPNTTVTPAIHPNPEKGPNQLQTTLIQALLCPSFGWGLYGWVVVLDSMIGSRRPLSLAKGSPGIEAEKAGKRPKASASATNCQVSPIPMTQFVGDLLQLGPSAEGRALSLDIHSPL